MINDVSGDLVWGYLTDGTLTSRSPSIGNLRLASQHSANPPSLPRMVEIGIQFEKSTFDKAPNKVCDPM